MTSQSVESSIYPAYKPSGIDWVGDVPEHWEVRRLKHIASVQLSSVDKHTIKGEEPIRLCNYVDVYYNDFIRDVIDFMAATATRSEIARFQLRHGDVLITKDSETWDDIAVPAYVAEELDGVLCGYHLAHIRPDLRKVLGEYLFRAFRSRGVNDQFRVAANGITRFGLGKYWLDNGLFPVPPLAEQKAIAAFLDRETARIDALIEKKRRQIELLQEKRSALISHAVTKGHDPGAPMKDSGIDWLGQIPTHWGCAQFRRFIKRLEQGWSPQSEQGLADEDGWAILKVGAVYRGTFRSEEHKSLPSDIEPVSRYEVREGDLLLTRGNTPELVADACIVPQVRQKLLISDLHYRIELSEDECLRPFACYWLISNRGRQQIQSDAHGTSNSMVKVSQAHIKSWIIVAPPVSEQERIVEYLDAACKRTAALIDWIKRSIVHLEEYRSAVISAAVTGKIDVRREVA